MSFLQIGALVVPVSTSAAAQRSPERIGSSTRMFDGNLRTAVKKEKRSWVVTTKLLTSAEAAAVELIARKGTFTYCSGDLLDATRSVPDLVNASAYDDLLALGAIHTRADTATYYDIDGVIRTAASGVLRTAHYVNGVRYILLEKAIANLSRRSQEFDNAEWTKSGVTVAANNTVAPDGTLTADKLTSAGAAAGEFIIGATNLGYTGNGEKCVFIHLKNGNAATSALSVWDSGASTHRHLAIITWTNGVPSLTTSTGTGTLFEVVALAFGFYRIAISGTGVIAANDNRYLLYPTGTGTAAGYIWAWGSQAMNCAYPLSYTPTGASSVSRAEDQLYFPETTLLAPPQESTAYIKFKEQGTSFGGGSEGVLSLGPSANPSVMLLTGGGGQYYAIDRKTADQASGTPAGAPVQGQTVELRVVIAKNGSVTTGQSINAAADTVSTTSPSPTGLPGAWNLERFYVGSRGAGTEGGYLIEKIVHAPGTRTMAELRGGAAVKCELTLGDSPYTPAGASFKRALTLTLKEV